MDRSWIALALALGVCTAARADRFEVRGQDRSGGAIEGVVDLEAQEGPDGAVRRRLSARLGALTLTGSVDDEGVLTLGPEPSESSGEATGDAVHAAPRESLPGLAEILEARKALYAKEPAAEEAPAPVASREPQSGRVQLSDGLLRLDLLDGAGRPLIRVAGRREVQAASVAASVSPAGAAGGGQTIRARGGTGAPREQPAPATPAAKAVERAAAAEERLDGVARELAQRDPEAADADAYADAAYGGDALQEPAPPSDDDVAEGWDALRADYAQALEEGDLAQDAAREEILDSGDVDAAHALVGLTSERLAAWEDAGSDPVARGQVARLRDQRQRAQDVRDRLETGATRAALEDGDLRQAEALVRESTARLASSQVRLADTQEVSAEQRADHERLIELQRQAAQARDRLHDARVREILERGDVEAAADLAATSAARLAQSERTLLDAWDEATALRDEHARLAWHYQNAVELRGHVLQSAGRRALRERDLEAASALVETATRELAAQERQVSAAEEPTQVEAQELRWLQTQQRRAAELRTEVHRELLRGAESRQDLAGALQVLAQDSARLAAFAVHNQARAAQLGAVEQAEGLALMEYQQDAIALRLELSQRLLQDARLRPERAGAVVVATEAGLRAFDRELAARGLGQGPLPQVVVDERAALEAQLAEARALAARAR